LCNSKRKPGSRRMLRSGSRAPVLELPSGDGAVISLDQIWANGPALLAFFKVSCPVCQYTFPFLERLAAAKKVQVVGISQDDPETAREFARTFGVSFPMLFDELSRGYPASNAFGITNVPSLFLVGSDGTILLASTGFSRADLENLGRQFHTAVFRQGEKVPEFRPG
jgi:peroxiredoxin